MFCIGYAFKGQVHVFAGQVKTVQDKYDRKRSGSVVECLTQDRGLAGSILTDDTAFSP